MTWTLKFQELCERRGGRPGLPVPNSPYGLCGRKGTLNGHGPAAQPALQQGAAFEYVRNVHTIAFFSWWWWRVTVAAAAVCFIPSLVVVVGVGVGGGVDCGGGPFFFLCVCVCVCMCVCVFVCVCVCVCKTRLYQRYNNSALISLI